MRCDKIAPSCSRCIRLGCECTIPKTVKRGRPSRAQVEERRRQQERERQAAGDDDDDDDDDDSVVLRLRTSGVRSGSGPEAYALE